MPIDISTDSLDPRVKDAGLLLNLLTGTGDTLTLNEAWFENPFSSDNIGGVGGRGTELIDLVVDFVGPAAPDPPTKASWHPITLKDKPTGLNVVVGTDGDTTLVSIGLYTTKTISEASPKLDATVYVLFPLFTFKGTTWTFVFGSTEHPAQIVGEITTDASFSAGGKDYSTLAVTGNFVLNGDPPSFAVDFVAKDGTPVDAFTSLQALLDGDATDWINAVLAVSTVQTWLDTKIGTSTTESIASVLAAAKLLNEGSPPTVADLSEFLHQNPVDVAKNMLLEALTILATQQKPLIPVGDDGGFWIVKESADGTDRYGVRMTLPDVGKSAGEGAPAATEAGTAAPGGGDGASENKPQALLQIGKWFTGETTAADSWLKRVDSSIADDLEPGAYAYLLQNASGTLSFTPRIELVSVGFDYVGGNDKPLINVKGVELGGFEPRMYLAFDLSAQANVEFGGGLRMDSLSLPLAGNINKPTGDNAVASNLLAAGDDGGTGSGDGGDPGGDAGAAEKGAVNPPFSVSAAGMGSELSVQLYGPDDAKTERVWFPIARSFGPLECKKIGIEWVDADRFLSVLFDGGVQLAALSVELMGLSVGMDVRHPTDLSSYKLGLDGLAVAYSAAGIAITGGFLRDGDTKPVAYNGQAHVQAGPFGLGALGSYTTIPDDGAAPTSTGGKTSLFVFAFIDYPLGGPGFFFITGLAGGFGYNRSLKMPQQDQVSKMPLVAALRDPSAIGGTDATPTEALSKIATFVPPTRGENFITAGLKFTTYEIVNSIALIAVQFGSRTEIDLLGISSIKLPQVGATYAYAELDLLVIIAPDEGEFKASLVLGPESFVIDKACKLTGGFAFYAWFGPSEYAGQFVITLGGYHPAFDPPSYYPTEPRLGFNWPVTKELTIKGGAYFALTPSCVMAGGDLSVTYASGGLKAWFKAYADFIIYWKPFYFDAKIGVSIGASYTFKVFGAKVTASVSLGADLELWGPPTGGKVHVSWFIISFTIGFGQPELKRVPMIKWDEFAALLPTSGKPDDASQAALQALATNGAAPDPKVVSISIADGLLTEMTENGDTVWFIRPDEFTWFTKTTIPATAAVLGTDTVTTSNGGQAATTDLGARPMGIETYDGTHTITVTGPDDISAFDHDLDLGSQPEAMWGQPVLLSSLTPSAKVIDDCILGVMGLHPKPHATLVGPPIIDAAKAFTFILLDKDDPYWLPLSPSYTPPTSGGPVPSPTTLDSIHDTLEPTAPTRTAVFDALASLGVNAGANGDLAALAANPTAAFIASPMIGSVS